MSSSVASAAEEESVHHRFLYRLVAGSAGITTADLQQAYEAVAPLVYHGTMSSPVQRRSRRKFLKELVEEGAIDSFDTPRGRVWVPLDLPDDLSVGQAAQAARAAQQSEREREHGEESDR